MAGPLAVLAWRRAQPVVGILSAAAWILLGLAVVALVAGFVLGWQELLYPAFTVLAALLVAAIFLVGRTTYRVTIALTPSRVEVGERAIGRVEVANSGTRPLLAARLELPVGAALASFSIPPLAVGESHDELFAVPTHRRAVIVAGPATSVRGDQVGLLRRAIRWTDPVDLFVHPKTVRLQPSAAGLVRDLEGQVTKRITNNDLSFHALRPYAPGDDRRNVHWRTSARLSALTGDPNTLMVRQFEETRRSQLTILLGEFGDYYASEEEFELAVSVMASLATQVIRDGTQMSVVTETRQLRTHTPLAVLDDSSRLERTAKGHSSVRDFARISTRRLPPPSVVIIIGGSRISTAELRTAEQVFPSDATLLCFRIQEGAAPGLATVSSMQLATLGVLTDLPKIMRRAGGE